MFDAPKEAWEIKLEEDALGSSDDVTGVTGGGAKPEAGALVAKPPLARGMSMQEEWMIEVSEVMWPTQGSNHTITRHPIPLRPTLRHATPRHATPRHALCAHRPCVAVAYAIHHTAPPLYPT